MNSIAMLLLCFAVAVLNSLEGLWVVCGVWCVVYLGDGGVISLMERWCCEHRNKLVEQEALIDSGRVQSAELKDFWCLVFAALNLYTIIIGIKDLDLYKLRAMRPSISPARDNCWKFAGILDQHCFLLSSRASITPFAEYPPSCPLEPRIRQLHSKQKIKLLNKVPLTRLQDEDIGSRKEAIFKSCSGFSFCAVFSSASVTEK